MIADYDDPARRALLPSEVREALRFYDRDGSSTLDSSEIESLRSDAELLHSARLAGYGRAMAQCARYLVRCRRVASHELSCLHPMSIPLQAFTSDVGEAARPVVHPRIVTAAYGISWLYCIGDVAFSASLARARGAPPREVLEVVAEKS